MDLMNNFLTLMLAGYALVTLAPYLYIYFFYEEISMWHEKEFVDFLPLMIPFWPLAIAIYFLIIRKNDEH